MVDPPAPPPPPTDCANIPGEVFPLVCKLVVDMTATESLDPPGPPVPPRFTVADAPVAPAVPLMLIALPPAPPPPPNDCANIAAEVSPRVIILPSSEFTETDEASPPLAPEPPIFTPADIDVEPAVNVPEILSPPDPPPPPRDWA